MPDQPFTPFVNGEIRCPRCHRKQPMESLLIEYVPAQDFGTVKGIYCDRCREASPKDLPPGLVAFGSWLPNGTKNVQHMLTEPNCPFCGKVVVRVPDDSLLSGHAREFEYVRCPGSPLVYRLVA